MSYDMIIEDVPSFVRRIGDNVIQGSNNTIMILGTDRCSPNAAKISDGLGHSSAKNGGKGAGAIHLIAGRAESDPNIGKDSSSLYLSMLSEVDKNVKTDFEGSLGTGPCAILRSDAIRLPARGNVKISIDNSETYVVLKKEEIVLRTGAGVIRMLPDKIVIDSGRIELGSGAGERVILGDSFLKKFVTHTHPSAAGQTGPVIEPFGDDLLSQRTVYVT